MTASSGAKDGVIPPGLPAPGFTLPAMGGGEISLPDPSARGLSLYVFYKNTCPTCRLIAPLLQRLADATAGVGGRVIGISQDGMDGARSFSQEFGLTFPIAVDGPGWPVSSQYDLVAVPTLYLVDAAGTIRSSGAGFHKERFEGMGRDLAASWGAPAPGLYRDGESYPEMKPG